MNLIHDLDRTIDLLLADLAADPFAKRLLDGVISTDEYAAFLVQTYLYVRHTRPLLQRAARRLLGAKGRSDLASLFAQKADEERGHERWALADLCALGRDEASVRCAAPTDAVAAYIAWNTFTVEHGTPIAFLGTAYVLEALAAARARTTAENLVRHSSIPNIERAVTFLCGHADADTGHIEHLGRMLVALAEGVPDRDDVILSAGITRSVYTKLLSMPGSSAPHAALL